MIRNRSEENRRAMQSFHHVHDVLSPAFAIVRQELDSLVRVIYLLALKTIPERHRLIGSTLCGEKWKVQTPKGKWMDVTDRTMIDLAAVTGMDAICL